MVIYRPHRGGLAEAMEEKAEFPSFPDLLDYIVETNTDQEWGPAFSQDDLVVGESRFDDPRVGWRRCRWICTKRYFGKEYPIPAPIGMFSDDYDK